MSLTFLLATIQAKFADLNRQYQKHKVNEERNKILDCIDKMILTVEKSSLSEEDKIELKRPFLEISRHFANKSVQSFIKPQFGVL